MIFLKEYYCILFCYYCICSFIVFYCRNGLTTVVRRTISSEGIMLVEMEVNYLELEMKAFIFFNSFVHSFIFSPIHPLICSFAHLFICLLVHLFICSLVHLFICSFVHLFIGLLVHWFIGSLVHRFIG